MYELTTPVVTVLWIAAGASGLAGLVLYDRVLAGLGRSVQAFAESLPNEDGEPERNRSREDEGEDADSQEEPVEATD
jgi:hypothetical protein